MSPDDRFWAKVQRGADEHCWLWMAQTSPGGYGRFWSGERTVQAHRYAYEALVGPVPSGLTLDHLCRTKRCVNPAHLEPVTIAENVARWGRSVTHCPQGHEYTPENTKQTKRGRQCRACQYRHDSGPGKLARVARWRERRREYARLRGEQRG